MKNKIIILIGAPCSGKSTWAKEYIKENRKTLRFNRDDIRMMMKNYPMLDGAEESVVTEMIYTGVSSGTSIGRDIIIDQTNVRLKYINGFIKTFCELHDMEVILVVIKRDVNLLLERNIERSTQTGIAKIPEDVIRRMYSQLEEMLKNKEFLKLTEIYELRLV